MYLMTWDILTETVLQNNFTFCIQLCLKKSTHKNVNYGICMLVALWVSELSCFIQIFYLIRRQIFFSLCVWGGMGDRDDVKGFNSGLDGVQEG